MRILITGVCGNVGASTLTALLRGGHEVVGVDIENRKNLRFSQKQRNNARFVFGDIRSAQFLRSLLPGVDAVIHLAAIIPPLTDRDPLFAESVNVGATRTLVGEIGKRASPPLLVFTSSIAVYGDRINTPFIREHDELRPSPGDHYALHKIECERIIRGSAIPWTILRLSYIVSTDRLIMDPILFAMPQATAIEPCMTADAGAACAAAAVRPDLSGRTFLIAGGVRNRTMYRDYLDTMFRAFGLGGNFLPDEAFAHAGFHCGFMDTEVSERELCYQHENLVEFYRSVRRRKWIQRWSTRIVRPLARGYILTRSPYFRRYLADRYQSAGRRVFGVIALCMGLLPIDRPLISRRQSRGCPTAS